MDALYSIVQTLQLNQTFFVYLAVFACFLLLTDKFLLSPAYRRFLKQESLTKGQVLQSQNLQEENEKLQQKYEQILLLYNQRIQEALNQEKQKLQTLKQEQINQAQKEAEKLIIQTKKSLNEECSKAQKDLFDQVPQLAQQFLSQVN